MSRIQEITALAEQRLGLAPRHHWDEHLRAAIKTTAIARGVSQEQLLEQIKRNPDLFNSIIGALTVGESYFFRHPTHFQALVAAAQRHLAQSAESFHVWSAGCAGGEEPYSAALTLRQQLPVVDLARVSILATDVNAAAIERAAAGVFPRWAFREAMASGLDAYFTPRPHDVRELRSDVRRQVTFRHVSLQDQLALLPAESKDVIFFRNVSVYLTTAATAAIYRGFSRVLRPSGLLFVSPTDVRPPLDEFRPYREDDSTTFERRSSSVSRSSPDSRSSPVSRSSPDSRSSPVSRVLVRGGFDAAVAPAMPTLTGRILSTGHANPSRSCDDLNAVDELADRGDLSGALDLLARHFDSAQPSAALYERRGRLRLAMGHATQAVEDYRRVLYLEPQNYTARYWYALALRQAGNADLAKQQLNVLIAEFADLPEDLRSSAKSLMGAMT